LAESLFYPKLFLVLVLVLWKIPSNSWWETTALLFCNSRDIFRLILDYFCLYRIFWLCYNLFTLWFRDYLMKNTWLFSYILVFIGKLVESRVTSNLIFFIGFMFRWKMHKTKTLTQSLRMAPLFFYCSKFNFGFLFTIIISWWNYTYLMKRILCFSELSFSFQLAAFEVLKIFNLHFLKKTFLKGWM